MKRFLLAIMCVLALVLAPSANALTVATVAGYAQPHNAVQDQLQGQICNDNPNLSANKCTPVVYDNLSVFVYEAIQQGANNLNAFLATSPKPTLVFAYSEGAIAALTYIEQHMNDPNRPANSDVSFIVIGNPSRNSGGIDKFFQGTPYADITGTPWKVTDIGRQYELWTDFPNNTSSPYFFLAVSNAIQGAYLHDYTQVDPNDPDMVVWTVGNITYKLLPTDLLPMYEWLRWTGPFAQWLDSQTRWKIEDAYLDGVDNRTVYSGFPNTATTVATQEVSSLGALSESIVAPTISTVSTSKKVASPPLKHPKKTSTSTGGDSSATAHKSETTGKPPTTGVTGKSSVSSATGKKSSASDHLKKVDKVDTKKVDKK